MKKSYVIFSVLVTGLMLSACAKEAPMPEEKAPFAAGQATVATSIQVTAPVAQASESAGRLQEFDTSAFEAAKASGDLVVLYFYANWCPVCKEELPELKAAFENLKDKNVKGFIVNFRDSETSPEEEALAKEYGVPYQHTKIFLKGGNQLLKAPDSWNQGRYIEEITKAL